MINMKKSKALWVGIWGCSCAFLEELQIVMSPPGVRDVLGLPFGSDSVASLNWEKWFASCRA